MIEITKPDMWKYRTCSECAYYTISRLNIPKDSISHISVCRKFNYMNEDSLFENDDACPDFVLAPEVEEVENEKKEKVNP